MADSHPLARELNISVSKEAIEQLLPDSLGWVWIRDHRYSTWVRVAPVWSRAPWTLHINPGIPLAPCFPVVPHLFASFQDVTTGVVTVIQRQRRTSRWKAVLLGMIAKAHVRAQDLATGGEPVPFPGQSAMWEEWISRTLDDATYASEEYATVSAGT